MTNVKDLNIKTEIINLFDYTNSQYSRNTLNNIFHNYPTSLEGIYERQHIIKGFMNNWSILHTFSYLKLELEEVYLLFENIQRGNFNIVKNRLTSKFRLIVSNNERSRKRGKYIQLINLFDKLYNQYLVNIDHDKFPKYFAGKIDMMKRFILSFDLDHRSNLARNGTLSVDDIVSIEQVILDKLTNNEVSLFWENFFLFDAYLSITRGVIQQKYNFPSFGPKFSIEGFYHPLVKNAIKNNISPSGNVILITGPNMSGKSTLLKSISLCVHLGHLGLGVPASKCEIPYFNNISVAIDLNDDMIRGYSHFMTEIKNLKNVITEARNGSVCFSVFDEIFKGTNIDDALEITKMTIKGLPKFKNSIFFISTHLYQLSTFIEEYKNGIDSYYIECSLEEGTPEFTYKLRKGWSHLKIGKILFEKEGLKKLLE